MTDCAGPAIGGAWVTYVLGNDFGQTDVTLVDQRGGEQEDYRSCGTGTGIRTPV